MDIWINLGTHRKRSMKNEKRRANKKKNERGMNDSNARWILIEIFAVNIKTFSIESRKRKAIFHGKDLNYLNELSNNNASQLVYACYSSSRVMFRERFDKWNERNFTAAERETCVIWTDVEWIECIWTTVHGFNTNTDSLSRLPVSCCRQQSISLGAVYIFVRQTRLA